MRLGKPLRQPDIALPVTERDMLGLHAKPVNLKVRGAAPLGRADLVPSRPDAETPVHHAETAQRERRGRTIAARRHTKLFGRRHDLPKTPRKVEPASGEPFKEVVGSEQRRLGDMSTVGAMPRREADEILLRVAPRDERSEELEI